MHLQCRQCGGRVAESRRQRRTASSESIWLILEAGISDLLVKALEAATSQKPRILKYFSAVALIALFSIFLQVSSLCISTNPKR